MTAEPSSAAVSAGAGGGAISAGAGGGAVSAGAGGGLGLVDYDSDEGESDDAQPEPEQKPAAAPTVGGVLYAGKLFASQEAVEVRLDRPDTATWRAKTNGSVRVGLPHRRLQKKKVPNPKKQSALL